MALNAGHTTLQAPEVSDVTDAGGAIIHVCWGSLDLSYWCSQTMQMDKRWDAVGKTGPLAEIQPPLLEVTDLHEEEHWVWQHMESFSNMSGECTPEGDEDY